MPYICSLEQQTKTCNSILVLLLVDVEMLTFSRGGGFHVKADGELKEVAGRECANFWSCMQILLLSTLRYHVLHYTSGL